MLELLLLAAILDSQRSSGGRPITVQVMTPEQREKLNRLGSHNVTKAALECQRTGKPVKVGDTLVMNARARREYQSNRS